LGTRVHTTLVIMQLEQYNSPNPKIPLWKVQCSHVITFMYLLWHCVMES
jgi:hypothetical protein